MAIQVLKAEDADMYRIFEIASLAFGNEEPLFKATYPKHWTEAGRIQASERFKEIKNTDPSVTYLKAVDDRSGLILGMARWNIYDGTIPDPNKNKRDDKDYWDNEEEKEYASALNKGFLKERTGTIARTNGNVVCLDILAVDPASQRGGVGSALVAWGTKLADQMGVEAVVESSPFGKGLYQKYGFEFVKDFVIQVPEKFADREKQEFAWLVRPKKSQ